MIRNSTKTLIRGRIPLFYLHVRILSHFNSVQLRSYLDFNKHAKYFGTQSDPSDSSTPLVDPPDKKVEKAQSPSKTPSSLEEQKILSKVNGLFVSNNYSLAKVILEDLNPPAISVLHEKLAQLKFHQARQLAMTIVTRRDRIKFLSTLKKDINIHPYSSSLVALFLKHATGGHIRLGQKMFDRLSNPTRFAFEGLITLMARTNDLEGILKLLKHQVEQGVKLGPCCLTKALLLCRHHKQWSKGLSLVAQGDHLKGDKGFQAEKVGMYAYSGEKLDAAEELMNGLVDNNLQSPQAFALLICGLIMHNEFSHAQKWFEKFEERYSLTPENARVYHAMVNGYVRSGNLTKAITLLNKLTSNSLPVQRATALNLILGLIEAKKVPDAVNWCKWLSNNYHKPLAHTFTQVLRKLTHHDEFEAAWELWDMLSSSGKISDLATNDLLLALNRHQQIERAYRVLHNLVERGRFLSYPGLSHYLANLIRANRAQEAISQFQKFESMGGKQFPALVYCSFIGHLKSIGWQEEAQQLANRLKSDTPGYRRVQKALANQHPQWWIIKNLENITKLEMPVNPQLPAEPPDKAMKSDSTLDKVESTDIWREFTMREIDRVHKREVDKEMKIEVT